MAATREFERIFRQNQIPIVYRPGGGAPLQVRLPYRRDDYWWLRDGRARNPKWNPAEQYWTVPNAWFSELVERIVRRYGSAYVIQRHRRMRKCAPACWNAKGIECECSCQGANHGTGHPGGRWYIISDTLAVEWDGQELYASRITLESPPELLPRIAVEPA